MDNDSKTLNDDEIEQFNMRCVVGALAFLENHADSEVTENELVKCFIHSKDEPQNTVQEEIKRVLDLSVTNGLIVRNGNKYALASRENKYQTDADPDDSDIEYIDPNYSHYEVHSSPTERMTGRGYKRVRSPSTRPRSPSASPVRPPKRKYTKKQPEPTTRVTRSASASKTRKRTKSKKEPQPATRFSARTLAKRGGRKSTGRGRGRGR